MNLNFASDNTGPAAPQIMAALTEANAAPAMPYGADPWTERATTLIRETFEAPEASVHLVATGSAANALALAAMTQPWQAIYCHNAAHIAVDECGAPEFYTGGAKLAGIDGPDGKITPDALQAAMAHHPRSDVHSVQPGTLSLTQLTELGTAYTGVEITALSATARAAGLPIHLDGARLANAIAASNLSPAEMTWRAVVNALSLGGTKNGCLGVEAVVFFDPAQTWELSLRRKRAGHLWSKHRFLGAQMAAYMTDGLWLDLAAKANAAMARLRAGLAQIPEAKVHAEPAGNLLFIDLPQALHDAAFAGGAGYYLFGQTGDGAHALVRARIVCDWSKSPEEVDQLLEFWRRG